MSRQLRRRPTIRHMRHSREILRWRRKVKGSAAPTAALSLPGSPRARRQLLHRTIEVQGLPSGARCGAAPIGAGRHSSTALALIVLFQMFNNSRHRRLIRRKVSLTCKEIQQLQKYQNIENVNKTSRKFSKLGIRNFRR